MKAARLLPHSTQATHWTLLFTFTSTDANCFKSFQSIEISVYHFLVKIPLTSKLKKKFCQVDSSFLVSKERHTERGRVKKHMVNIVARFANFSSFEFRIVHRDAFLKSFNVYKHYQQFWCTLFNGSEWLKVINRIKLMGRSRLINK